MARPYLNVDTDRQAFIASRNNVLGKSFVTDLWMKVIHRAIDDIVMYRSMREEDKELNEEEEEFEDSAYKFLFDDEYRIPVDDYLIDIQCPECQTLQSSRKMSEFSNSKVECTQCNTSLLSSCSLYKVADGTIVKDMNLRELLSLWGMEDIAGFRDGILERIEELVKKKKKTLKKKQERKRGMEFEAGITKVLDDIKTMLIEKNKKYGNSATDPVRIFSKTDRVEQIRVRIDDKISRVVRNTGEEDEDVRKDLIGYFVILHALESGYIK